MEKDITRQAILNLKESVLSFPENFLWGTSTSAYQFEGGNTNDWSEWENSPERLKKLRAEGRTVSDFICGEACDSYRRYKEDFDLCLKLDNNAVRFGIEWARIEPREGVWDVEAINHYREVLAAAKERNLKVVLTLWHYTNPVWVAEQGGWANGKTIEHFLEFTEVAVKEYGVYVDYWVTLNEPMVPLGFGYIKGSTPPAKRLSLYKAARAFFNLVKAHRQAYEIIHGHFKDARVGIAQLTNYFEPARKWFFLEVLFARIAQFFHQGYFFRLIKNRVDYVGLNYYHHDRIVWHPPFKKNKNEKLTDVGWEIYPEGIYHALKYVARFKKPILITENGLADAQDLKRSRFIVDHLRYVHQAISEGVDVRGYFHWSLLDNYEWHKGWAPKFGLYKMDRDTFWRTPRPSAKVYAEICRNNAVLLNNNDSS
jgi:beta-glucosidase